MNFLLTCFFALDFNAPAPLNVRDFGAKGDGAADDTRAINSALAAAHAEGARLYFPAGTYVCNQPDGSGNILTFNAGGVSNVELYGKGATIITQDTGSATKDSKLFYIYAFAPSDGLVISGLRFLSTHP